MTLKDSLDQLDRYLRSTDEAGFSAGLDWRQRPLSFWNILESIPQENAEDAFLGSEERRASAIQGNEPIVARLRQMQTQLHVISSAADCPILAITGMLNAGKSSLLAGFLSPAGRSRVLIGQANDQGTHRFVLWVPEAWKKNEQTWQLMNHQLRTVFGTIPEPLASDLQQAAQQYNGTITSGLASNDPLTVPLIATDPHLDQWGLALMDCPDIQTGLWQSEVQELGSPDATVAEASANRASHRATVLAQAMRLCSAFLVVTTANGLHDQLIFDLLTGMQRTVPSVDRMLLINRVPRRYVAAEIVDEVKQSFASFDLRRIYMAYNFEGPLHRERIPKPPEAMAIGELPLPLFFRVDRSPIPQPPDAIPNENFLTSIGTQVDPGKLMIASRKSLFDQYASTLKQAWSLIQQESQSREERLKRVWQMLAEACYGFSQQPTASASDSNIRLHASREIVAQLSESLERTAPFWAKPGRKILRIAQSTRDQIGNTMSKLNPSAWLGGKVEAAVEAAQGRFRRGENGKVVTADALADLLLQADYRGDFQGLRDNPTRLRQCSQRIIDRFQAESQTRLNDQDLDQYTATLWSQMTWKQRFMAGVAPSALIFGPLVAVVTLPFDFGGSSVLVLASMKELLLAGGIGLGAAFFSFDMMPKLAESQVAWQQLSDLFAVGCDELGIPRPTQERLPRLSNQGQVVPLLLPTIPEGKSMADSLIEGSFSCQNRFWDATRQLLTDMEKEIAK